MQLTRSISDRDLYLSSRLKIDSSLRRLAAIYSLAES